MRCTDYISANQYLREMGPRMSDTEKITYVAFNSVNPFPMRMISAIRAMYLEQVKVGLTQHEAYQLFIICYKDMYVYGFNSLCICILAVLSRCFVTLIHLYIHRCILHTYILYIVYAD